MAIKIEESNNDREIVEEESEKNKQGSWIVNKLESYFYWWVEFYKKKFKIFFERFTLFIILCTLYLAIENPKIVI